MHNKGRRKFFYPFSEKDFLHLSDILYLPLKYKENSVLICPPLYGKDHRIMQLWERKYDREKVLGGMVSQFQFSFIQLIAVEDKPENAWMSQIGNAIDLNEEKIVLFETFEKHVRTVLKDQNDLVFFINIPETLPDDLFSRFLALAQKIYYIHPSKIHFILAFDMKWDEDRFIEITSPFRSLFQNTKLLSLYPARETIHFIKYYSHIWNIVLTQKTIDYIVEHSGGIMLLAKSALRIIRNEKVKTSQVLHSIIPTHPDHKLQIDFFLQRLTKRQQTILKLIANCEKVEDREVYHLEQMGIVDNLPLGWRIKSKFIELYLTKNTESFAQRKQLILNESSFTSREKEILTMLLKEPGIIVSRSTIAHVLWGEQNYEKYSDWAIDKTISRVRGKLSKNLPLSGLVLQTHKKVGFSLK